LNPNAAVFECREVHIIYKPVNFIGFLG
jgi:hypothetical protein